MYLITSAAYITGDLATEYGKIPPTFLPLQNKQLYIHQLALFNKEETVVLSLPEGFVIPKNDKLFFDESKVNIVYVPIGLSLGQSIVYVLNITANYNEPLRILHGDTLFYSIPTELDIYSIAQTLDNYDWDISEEFKTNEYIYAGFFSFSDQILLIQSITKASYNFIGGILNYKRLNKVSEKKSDMRLDFGHANTFYQSRINFTTQRVFNTLEIDGFSVKKWSEDKIKILGEANWFNSMPIEIKKYIPSLWDFGEHGKKGYYQIEYFYLSSLADLFVYGRNEFFIWKNILTACNQFLSNCLIFKPEKEDEITSLTKRLYKEKTDKRLHLFSSENNVDLNKEWLYNGIKVPSINQIVKEINDSICEITTQHLSIIHGDFCFSNILYNFRTKSIKVIDPRGIDIDRNQTIYGDIRYDIAKLSHSVLGLYDFIISGVFEYEEIAPYNVKFNIPIDENVKKVQSFFVSLKLGGFSIKEANTFPILIHLFLSMLPLHNENKLRQRALLANAIRLYLEFKEN